MGHLSLVGLHLEALEGHSNHSWVAFRGPEVGH